MSPRRQDPLDAQAKQLAKDWADLYHQFQQVQKQAEALNALLNARIEEIQALRQRSEEAERGYRDMCRHMERLLDTLEVILARPWPPEARSFQNDIAHAVASARQALSTQRGARGLWAGPP